MQDANRITVRELRESDVVQHAYGVARVDATRLALLSATALASAAVEGGGGSNSVGGAEPLMGAAAFTRAVAAWDALIAASLAHAPRAPGAQLWVAVDEAHAGAAEGADADRYLVGIACAEYSASVRHRVTLQHLYVAPHRTGAGVGSRLLDAVRAAMPHSARAELVLKCHRGTRAAAFYAARGFAEIPRARVDAYAAAFLYLEARWPTLPARAEDDARTPHQREAEARRLALEAEDAERLERARRTMEERAVQDEALEATRKRRRIASPDIRAAAAAAPDIAPAPGAPAAPKSTLPAPAGARPAPADARPAPASASVGAPPAPKNAPPAPNKTMAAPGSAPPPPAPGAPAGAGGAPVSPVSALPGAGAHAPPASVCAACAERRATLYDPVTQRCFCSAACFDADDAAAAAACAR